MGADRGYRVTPEKIKFYRGQRGWNGRKFAEEAGLAPALVNRIEKGHVESPHYSTLEKMAAALGVEVSDLIEPTAHLVAS